MAPVANTARSPSFLGLLRLVLPRLPLSTAVLLRRPTILVVVRPRSFVVQPFATVLLRMSHLATIVARTLLRRRRCRFRLGLAVVLVPGPWAIISRCVCNRLRGRRSPCLAGAFRNYSSAVKGRKHRRRQLVPRLARAMLPRAIKDGLAIAPPICSGTCEETRSGGRDDVSPG